MQPTLPQTAGTADMDLTAVQSMDWLFKKERIYLLAQFWQQRATLAEKEVNTLKEQLSTTSTATSTTSTSSTTTTTAPSIHSSPPSPSSVSTTPIPNIRLSSPTINNNNSFNNNNKLNSVAIPQHLHQNGNLLAATPSPSPPLSENGSTLNGCLNSVKLLFNHNQIMETTPAASNTASEISAVLAAGTTNPAPNSATTVGATFTDASKLITAMTAEMNLHQDSSESATLASNQISIRSHSPLLSTVEGSSGNEETRNNNNNNSTSNNNNNNNTNSNSNSSSSYNNHFADELAAKEKEIKALIAEVNRLQTLHESHIVQIQRLEDNLEVKRQHILKLETRLQKQPQLFKNAEASAVEPVSCPEEKESISIVSSEPPTTVEEIQVKKENQLPSTTSDITSQPEASVNDPKHFQELIIERTKALAVAAHASSETLKGEDSHPTSSTTTTGSHLQQPPLHHHQHLHHQHQHPSLQHHQQQQHHHQDFEKANSHHDSSSTASTPNLQDQRSNDGHITGSKSAKSQEDNNNSLGSLTHLPPAFLPGLPFQFQDRGHFRFAEDIQLPPGASMAGRLGESLIPKGDPMEAKLQEMLRYNMDKYANQSLDTLHISRRVRELLSVHNIGQRLFAKYILGLSQGTVSELLSKPKPWDKLTEKGRDSYRKMHAWGCDDNAVMLLKSLIPKKDSGIPQYGRNEDSMSDDRIAHILNEASSLMKTPQGPGSQLQQQMKHESQRHYQQPSSSIDDEQSNDDSKSPHASCTSPFYKESPVQQQQQQQQQQQIQQRQEAQRRSAKPDEMSQDKMARIYQEELQKLMTRNPRDAFPSFLFPHFLSATGGLPPASSTIPPDDNIRMALEAYHREMAKLQQNNSGSIPNFPNFSSLMALQQQVLNGAQDLSVPKENEIKVNGQRHSLESCDSSSNQTKETAEEAAQRHSSAFSLVRLKPDAAPAPNSIPNPNTNSAAPSPLSNSILPPAMTANEDFSAAASPLQRMASITNSLITQPPVTPHHTQPQRPTKAVLPPITQQQFDMFNNLNTEDIVRRVKEALSQYSISQRLFGESVLGLSQGSVSDLLARPKPWHMLTQKGREPFIRMKMFLEDENAVHKLVASQYKIAPEKLMRTGSYSGSPQIPQGLANKMNSIPMQKMMNDLKMEPQAQHIMQQMQAASAMAAAAAAGHLQNAQHQGMLLTTPGLPPQHAISLQQAAANAAANEKKPMMMPIHSPHQANAMRSSMHQHMSPTVYEMAALTQDLDTQVITTKIKEALLANNIGQKIFGEAVLGLSQGSVSELLSKPKPWHMLSIKGREPFIRMQLWLSDANNVERLQVLKNERREASKRRRSTGPNQQDNSSDTSSNDTADFYTSSPGPGSVGSVGAPPNKKQRVLFSEEQKEALRLAFALDPYPNVGTIEFLANELGLATRTITNWFHNHRMRLKQQVPHGQPSEPVPSRENTNATPFDPIQFRILLNQRLMELQKERMGLSGAPMPYPPYFAANPNLAALIGRGLLPGGTEPDLQALNNAFKEQMSGLDLSLKRERDGDYDDDGEDESHLSDNESINESDEKSEMSETPRSSLYGNIGQSRTSRRKPAAPQWVNPDWQGDGKTGLVPPITAGGPNDKEVIINGVCVMQQQAADYSQKSGNGEDDEECPSDANDEEPTTHHRGQSSDCEDARADIDQRFMEPEVRIKQEEDCDTNDSHQDDLDLRKQQHHHQDEDDDTPGAWNY
ncbi:homeobox protein cut isoform X2 [Episyrphus balteatus]|uniref:homeobox protein cut isoform X2 n=1 Tax=Episyrphus balteatus TaxID=286459 RepID=UPI002485F6EA|nr:homeobox protein cut isoform X2 [Episyrphus balteatus]